MSERDMSDPMVLAQMLEEGYPLPRSAAGAIKKLVIERDMHKGIAKEWLAEAERLRADMLAWKDAANIHQEEAEKLKAMNRNRQEECGACGEPLDYDDGYNHDTGAPEFLAVCDACGVDDGQQ